jgi:V/A-type H+/Na+-transporting ATPase subunit C
VTLRAASADFVYGNTRLRARKAELLGAAEYEALLGRDLEGLVEALTASAYRADLEAALAVTGADRRALNEALRRHLARALEGLRAFYEGSARELVDLLLSRFDLHNLLTLVRGRVRGQAAEEVLANVLPLGALGGAPAQEIASQPELARTVDLLVAWPIRSWPARLPTPGPSTSAPRTSRPSSTRSRLVTLSVSPRLSTPPVPVPTRSASSWRASTTRSTC